MYCSKVIVQASESESGSDEVVDSMVSRYVGRLACEVEFKSEVLC